MTVILCALAVGLLVVSGAFGGEKVFLSFGTSGQGGTTYPVGVGMANIWNKYIPNLNVSAQATGGTANNIQLFEQGEIEIDIGDGLHYEAFTGTDKFAGKKPLSFLRGVLPVFPETAYILVKKGSPIKSIHDLRGRRVSIGPVASGSEVTNRALLLLAGIDPDKDIFKEHIGRSELVRAFTDNQVDVVMETGAIGFAPVIEMTTLDLVDFIELPDDVVEKFVAQKPYYSPFTMPANSYKGQTKEVKSISNWVCFYVHESLDADLVYSMAKAIFDHHEELINVNKVTQLTQAKYFEAVPVPLHEGAKRYYREIGLLKQ